MSPAEGIWPDRTLAALAGLTGLAGLPGLPVGAVPSLELLTEEVAIRYADRFAPGDRDYPGLSDRPSWHSSVIEALAGLRADGLVAEADPPQLTPAGLDATGAATARLDAVPADDAPADDAPADDAPAGRPDRQFMVAGVISTPLRDPAARADLGFSAEEDVPVPVMAELNLQFGLGTRAAFARLDQLWQRVTGGDRPAMIADRYVAGELTMHELKRLVAADAVPIRWRGRSLYHVWPDFPVRPHIDASCVTVKADAARKTFDADGHGIVWAVVDSGIDATHPHFAAYRTLNDDSVKDLHRFFPVAGEPTADGALDDTSGHGTHVAGIIAGALGPWLRAKPERAVLATESRYNVENPNQPMRTPRQLDDPDDLAGMAPRARLVSLKALGSGGTLNDRVHRVIQALAYVREVNGDGVEGMRIHGVNLSVGYEFDPMWFACGRSPLCQEIDRLVRSGVVVVVAAGNSGYGSLSVLMGGPGKFGLAMTINDPGNAELAITVGSTHRTAPHSYGVSYFSSKGPTGDGRNKPDLVAPGERITSCAAGENLAAVLGAAVPAETAVYVEDTGTSMAAPHVSGAIAALLSVRREFIGEPERLKQIFMDAATDLGRGKEFQGAGMLDLMRALQQKI